MEITLLNIEPVRSQCVNKDFMAGYGWSFNAGTSLRARLINYVKKKGEMLPIMSLGYIAAIFKEHGHSVNYLTNKVPASDIAFISSSMVDYRNEIEWGKRLRAAGIKVYFIGTY